MEGKGRCFFSLLLKWEAKHFFFGEESEPTVFALLLLQMALLMIIAREMNEEINRKNVIDQN